MRTARCFKVLVQNRALAAHPFSDPTEEEAPMGQQRFMQGLETRVNKKYQNQTAAMRTTGVIMYMTVLLCMQGRRGWEGRGDEVSKNDSEARLAQREKQSICAAGSRWGSKQTVQSNRVPQSLPFEITRDHTLRGGEFDVKREYAELGEEVCEVLWPHGFDVTECCLIQ